MPRLLLLRHAKAENTRPGSSDFERTLTKSGRRDSEAVGRLLAERGEAIDLVLCSAAARTRETWEGVASSLPGLLAAPEARFLRSLYDGGSYVSILQAEGGDAATILLVGHNPSIHAAALDLAADLSDRDGAVLAARFPKAALAILEVDGAWESLRPGCARLEAFVLPARADG